MENSVTPTIQPAAAPPSAGLSPWRVTLREEPGDTFAILFDCMAEDADHAAEQGRERLSRLRGCA